MNRELPDYLQILYPKEEIDAHVTALGEELTDWALDVEKRTSSPVLAVCVLRGAVFFFADLLRAVKCDVEPAFCRAWSYSSEVNNAQQKGVRVSVGEVAAAGRGILIVDDICDTGATLNRLVKVFEELSAAEVKTAVFIHRLVKNPLHKPDWSGFKYSGEEWFVGYGMEDKNRRQNLPDLFIVK